MEGCCLPTYWFEIMQPVNWPSIIKFSAGSSLVCMLQLIVIKCKLVGVYIWYKRDYDYFVYSPELLFHFFCSCIEFFNANPILLCILQKNKPHIASMLQAPECCPNLDTNLQVSMQCCPTYLSHTLQTFFSKVSISFLSWSSLNFISFSFSSRISLKLCPCSVVVPCPLILVCRSASTFLPYDYWIDKCKSWKICQCQAHTNRIYKMICWTVSLRFMVE